MNLTGLLPLLRQDSDVARVIRTGTAPVIPPNVSVTATSGIRAPLVAELAGGRPVVVVTATGRDTDDMVTALRAYLPDDDVDSFPSWETLPHERLSPRSDTVARRLSVLRRLTHPTDSGPGGPIRALVMPVRALLQPIVTGLADLDPVRVSVGDETGRDELVRMLEGAAYTRTDMVAKRGEYAVRGAILDVFAPTDPHPVRIEFWGDTVEELRAFSVADQRSLDAVDTLWAPPCRELLLTDSVRARARDLVPRLPNAASMLERISEGMAAEGMESLSPALADGMEPVLTHIPDNTLMVLSDPERITSRAADLSATTEEFLGASWAAAATGGQAPIDLSPASFVELDDMQSQALGRGLGWWSLTSLPSADELTDPAATGEATSAASNLADDDEDDESTLSAGSRVTIGARPQVRYRGDLDGALDNLKTKAAEGWRIVLTTPGAGPARRWVEQLAEADIPAHLADDLEGEPGPRVVTVTSPGSGHGFAHPSLQLALITESDLTGRAGASTRDMRRMPARRRGVVDPLALRPGDYVVHDQHGVGQFVELVARTVGKGRGKTSTREFLVIEYAPSKRGQPGDRLYVPTDALDQVTKYSGGESPSLNRMGGADWAKTKQRARKAVREIAGELVRLYAVRAASKGHAFGPDSPWQRELEDAFPHPETPDQLVSIDEVKADMEKTMPMDRLISGDVGYGKTEIAVRAAFKAVQDGKQVAVLVPTTLLVSQHYDTFLERFAHFPVRVAALSRFQTDQEAAEVIAGVKKGTVDVVIGTHRILTGQVQFKDLGLVVVDEEQRFGVEHKETLKQLRTNVDVLAMSATPIPRTLEMAVTGIREMSTLATPPEERHPVLTYVGPQEDKQISAAIRREMLREGQVFYIHNKVSDINKVAAHVQDLVPEARVAVAHGQMNEHQLERVINDFWERSSDVLVCTTIVETGLDISNANTLIVERADTFGLSQLHQLRGRVGRGRERAYAYFLYPAGQPLTDTAHDRLATIATHTDLGAGIQVALKDLEIRGAGNLLGGQQSGHVAGVGFDLYVRMVAEAVSQLKDGHADDEEPAEVKVELPVDAHIPTDYVEHERLRLEAYTKIANAKTDDELDQIKDELTDRYGALPEPVERLVVVARLRQNARAAGIHEMVPQGKYVRVAPVDVPQSRILRIKRLYPGTILKPAVRTALVPFPNSTKLGAKPMQDLELIEWAETLVAAIATPIEVGASQ